MKSISLKLLKKPDAFHEDVYHSSEKDLEKIVGSLGSDEDLASKK